VRDRDAFRLARSSGSKQDLGDVIERGGAMGMPRERPLVSDRASAIPGMQGFRSMEPFPDQQRPRVSKSVQCAPQRSPRAEVDRHDNDAFKD